MSSDMVAGDIYGQLEGKMGEVRGLNPQYVVSEPCQLYTYPGAINPLSKVSLSARDTDLFTLEVTTILKQLQTIP